MTGLPDPNLVLAFDFGLRRLGVATGNRLTGTATPLTTLKVGRRLPWDDLDAAIEAWRPGRLVVGLPSPERSPDLAEKVRAFAEELQRRYGLPVATTDEALTSRAAAARLKAARASGRMKRRVTRDDIDSGAACVIAERWMSSRP